MRRCRRLRPCRRMTPDNDREQRAREDDRFRPVHAQPGSCFNSTIRRAPIDAAVRARAPAAAPDPPGETEARHWTSGGRASVSVRTKPEDCLLRRLVVEDPGVLNHEPTEKLGGLRLCNRRHDVLL